MSRLDTNHPAINVNTLLRYSASITTHFLLGNRLLNDITYIPQPLPVSGILSSIINFPSKGNACHRNFKSYAL